MRMPPSSQSRGSSTGIPRRSTDGPECGDAPETSTASPTPHPFAVSPARSRFRPRLPPSHCKVSCLPLLAGRDCPRVQQLRYLKHDRLFPVNVILAGDVDRTVAERGACGVDAGLGADLRAEFFAQRMKRVARLQALAAQPQRQMFPNGRREQRLARREDAANRQEKNLKPLCRRFNCAPSHHFLKPCLRGQGELLGDREDVTAVRFERSADPEDGVGAF